MKYFGTIKSFDRTEGRGQIAPETGGDPLLFERSAFGWEKNDNPFVGQRLSYDLGTNGDRQPCAMNLQTI